MKYLALMVMLLPLCAAAQTVTILPTDAMINDKAEFVSLGESSYAILSPNPYSEEEIAVIRFRQAPGNEIDYHLHYETEEFFYVISGNMTMQIRDSTFTAGPGTFIHVPSGTPHSHGNQGNGELELLLIYNPGKMASLFRAWGNMVASGVQDAEQLKSRLLELPEDYDVEFINE